MYFHREIELKFKELYFQYPIVTVMGPRQSGKTTFVKHVLSDTPYVNLEDPTIRQLITADPNAFFDSYPDSLILDEIQKMPEILSYLQVRVDKQSNKTGLYVLTGSHQLELHQAISQSLAGRTAILTLLPLSLAELSQTIKLSLDELLLTGFYPRIYQKKLNPTEAYRYYFQTYIERDVRQLMHLKDLNLFQAFIKLCAGRIGQVINFSSFSNDIGVSAQTIKQWISLLEASYIIIKTTPYFENFGKRIIKAPKLYFTDVGLATFLLDIENISQIARDPLRGNLVENLVILDVVKHYYNQGKNISFYYFREQHGHEVDLIIKTGNQFLAFEIKAAKTFSENFLKGLDYFQKLVGPSRFKQGYLVYNGEAEQQIRNYQLVNFHNLTKELEGKDGN